MQSIRTRSRCAIFLVVYTLLASPSSSQENSEECLYCEEAAGLVNRYQLVEAASPARERPGWSAPERIVVLGRPQFADVLRSIAPEAEIISATGIENLLAVIPEADVYVGFCIPRVLDAGVSLKWIQSLAAGVEGCSSTPTVRERNILVTNTQRLYGSQIAEHAMAMILSFARNLHGYTTQQAAGRWAGSSDVVERVLSSGLWELEGKTVLVVGLGGIGTEVARLAAGFGMRIIATRNSRREGPEFVEYVGLAHEVNELAARADVVVSAVPLTEATTGMYDQAFFESMSETAYFINVGRGESVVTDDLVGALQSGKIAGAGLDVFYPDPLPPDHPLWGMSNVILTPHVAAASEDIRRRVMILVTENLRRYRAGRPMLSIVDVSRGY